MVLFAAEAVVGTFGRPAVPGLVDRARSGDADALRSLVIAAQAGDPQPFDAIVGLRLRETFRLARAILGTTEDAEDATQDAFLTAWRALPSLRDPGRFDAWFGRIVVNACRMSLRRRPAIATVPVDVLDSPGLGADDRQVDDVAEIDSLARAIDRLPVAQRAILALRHHEDRTVPEIARILDIPLGTAKWRLHEAHGALERALATDR